MIKRAVPILLLCEFLSGCMIRWQSQVNVIRLQPLRPAEVVSVVSGMRGVSIVSLPPRHLPESTIWEAIKVRRGNVDVLIRFPTPAGRKYEYAMHIDTYSRSRHGEAFVKDLAGFLQRKFGDPTRVPQVERIINDSGP